MRSEQVSTFKFLSIDSRGERVTRKLKPTVHVMIRSLFQILANAIYRHLYIGATEAKNATLEANVFPQNGIENGYQHLLAASTTLAWPLERSLPY